MVLPSRKNYLKGTPIGIPTATSVKSGVSNVSKIVDARGKITYSDEPPIASLPIAPRHSEFKGGALPVANNTAQLPQRPSQQQPQQQSQSQIVIPNLIAMKSVDGMQSAMDNKYANMQNENNIKVADGQNAAEQARINSERQAQQAAFNSTQNNDQFNLSLDDNRTAREQSQNNFMTTLADTKAGRDHQDALTEKRYELAAQNKSALNEFQNPEMSDEAIMNMAIGVQHGDALPKSIGKQNTAKILDTYSNIVSGKQTATQEQNDAYLARKTGTADAASLKRQTALGDSVAGSELNFHKNIDDFKVIAKDMGNSTSPIVQNWVQKGNTAIGSDPELQGAKVYLKEITNEFAKLTSGSPNGGGATALAEIQAAHDLLKSDFTYAQMNAAIAAMEASTKNRVESLKEVREGTSNRLIGREAVGDKKKETQQQAMPAGFEEFTKEEYDLYNQQFGGK